MDLIPWIRKKRKTGHNGGIQRGDQLYLQYFHFVKNNIWTKCLHLLIPGGKYMGVNISILGFLVFCIFKLYTHVYTQTVVNVIQMELSGPFDRMYKIGFVLGI